MCSALVGAFWLALLKGGGPPLLLPLLALMSGLAFGLDLVFLAMVSHAPRFLITAVEIILWAVGMQVLWLPYLAVVRTRGVSIWRRVLIFAGAYLAVVVLNVSAFVLVGVPFADRS